MAEQLTLATSEVIPQKVTTYYRPVRLLKDIEAPLIVVGLRGENGEYKSFTIEGDTARTLILTLNKANLSVKSEQARIMEWLAANRGLAGTVSGSPD
jgi:hypothetical protein